jgi:RNA polymerase sigma-70 factor, ECF subfamily
MGFYILDLAQQKAGDNKYIRDYLKYSSESNPHGKFDLAEHIDFCFTCICKTIPIEQQIALMLIDIYGFKAKEVALILCKGEAAIKHYIRFCKRNHDQNL